MTGAWEPSKVTAWLRGIAARVDALGPFELLEVAPTGEVAAIRDAYHRIAATRHPDLFRGRLDARDAELLMRVFAKITGAYAQLRDPGERARLAAPRPAAAAAAAPPVAAARAATPSGALPRKVSPRALSHVRRADALLATGDVASAVLHLRMAVAADPQSPELRQLLADTQARLPR